MARALEDDDKRALIFGTTINNMKFADNNELLAESTEVLESA